MPWSSYLTTKKCCHSSFRHSEFVISISCSPPVGPIHGCRNTSRSWRRHSRPGSIPPWSRRRPWRTSAAPGLPPGSPSPHAAESHDCGAPWLPHPGRPARHAARPSSHHHARAVCWGSVIRRSHHPLRRRSQLGQPSGGGKPRDRSCLHDPQGDTSGGNEGVNVIANLELMPLRLNISKKDKMGERQAALMVKLREAGWRW